MKKIISAVLSLALLFGCCTSSFAASQDRVLNTLKNLGVMTGDTNGNLNLDSNVTRAQFAKMLITESSYKNDAADKGTGFSMYTDVDKNHWAGRYLYIAAKQGWLTGYSDGSFRPDDSVKLEEVCSGVLKLLGYEASDIDGKYPDAYIDKADGLGLLDCVSASKGEYVTRKDIAYIFYNALLAETSTGKVYGDTIGVSTSSGVATYTSNETGRSDGIYYGVVKSADVGASTNGSTTLETSITVACTDGGSRTFMVDSKESYDAGEMVCVTVSSGVSSVSKVYQKALIGTVSSDASSVGLHKIAENVDILDSDSYGNTTLISKEDIAGKHLSFTSVRYYTENSSGAIDSLILYDVSGKLWENVLVTNVDSQFLFTEEDEAGISAADDSLVGSLVEVLDYITSFEYKGTITYISSGKASILSTDDTSYPLSVGGAQIRRGTDGSIVDMKSMSRIVVTAYTKSELMSSNMKYTIADDVQVYVYQGGNYYLSTVSDIDTDRFNIYGYISSVGTDNEVHIIVAKAK